MQYPDQPNVIVNQDPSASSVDTSNTEENIIQPDKQLTIDEVCIHTTISFINIHAMKIMKQSVKQSKMIDKMTTMISITTCRLCMHITFKATL